MSFERKKLLILTGRDGYLTTKLEGTMYTHILGKVDVNKIERCLRVDFEVERTTYTKLDLNRNFREYYVIYGSTEERGLFYKGYVEDILLRLMLDGAKLVPGYEYARAYGNKGFQEMLRKRFGILAINNLKSSVIGRYSDFDAGKYTHFPYVVKASSGSGSRGVRKVQNIKELSKTVKLFSKSAYYDYEFTRLKDLGYMKITYMFKIWLYKKMKKSQRLENPKKWFYANKVVVQEYIDGLDSDYKVLYYYGKYYVLNRKNRANDFRASGSGKFRFPEKVNEIRNILDFAAQCTSEMDVPMISMDIVSTGVECYLIEYQCLGFGPYTLQFSEWYFEKNASGWRRVDGKSNLETEIARSYKEYIKNHEE